MDPRSHALLDTLPADVRLAVQKAAVEAEVSTDVLMQLALGRAVFGHTDEHLGRAQVIIARAGLAPMVAALAKAWPAPPARPPERIPEPDRSEPLPAPRGA